jgi:hypothetical protein
MYRLILTLILLPFATAQAAGRGGDFDVCSERQVETAKKAAEFHGEERINRLIQADLLRAKKEEAEGDADECVEALDHAEKLLSGNY